mmetsp:Transcript_92336/g.296929  ORF Transcript_92336/g.296929 Transcript_92336/m.296929 type:complete len:201 (+) Transcript_92336:87-689(+)
MTRDGISGSRWSSAVEWECATRHYALSAAARLLRAPSEPRAAAGSSTEEERAAQRPIGVPVAARQVAFLEPSLARAVRSPGGPIWMSPQTAQKQEATHPELLASDYEAVLGAIEECLVVKEGRNGYTRHLLFLVKRGSRFAWRWWKAAVKASEDGSELYLVTLHPLQAGEIDVICDFGSIVRRARGRQGLTPFTPSHGIF